MRLYHRRNAISQTNHSYCFLIAYNTFEITSTAIRRCFLQKSIHTANSNDLAALTILQKVDIPFLKTKALQTTSCRFSYDHEIFYAYWTIATTGIAFKPGTTQSRIYKTKRLPMITRLVLFTRNISCFSQKTERHLLGNCNLFWPRRKFYNFLYVSALHLQNADNRSDSHTIWCLHSVFMLLNPKLSIRKLCGLHISLIFQKMT